MQIQNFDATGIAPSQGGGAHPPGTFPFVIGNTYGQENKDKTGGMLVVQFTTQMGSILSYYNLFNPSEKAVEIARKELSALSHATGVFKLSFLDTNNVVLPMSEWARELRGARGVIDIGPQVGNEKYMEVKKVYDQGGNEPGKGPAASPQPQQGQQGWAAANPQQNASQAPSNGPAGGWNSGAATQAPAQQQAPANAGGWQAGPSNNAPQGQGGAGAPPWASPNK
jgi:hypothetical protein